MSQKNNVIPGTSFMLHLAMCQNDDVATFTVITMTLTLVENKQEEETVSCLAGSCFCMYPVCVSHSLQLVIITVNK